MTSSSFIIHPSSLRQAQGKPLYHLRPLPRQGREINVLIADHDALQDPAQLPHPLRQAQGKSAGTLESAAIFCVFTKDLTGFRETLTVRLRSRSKKSDHHASR
ncbi:MAG: hypothetical protein AB1607_12880 [Chloroflexota bacterium]